MAIMVHAWRETNETEEVPAQGDLGADLLLTGELVNELWRFYAPEFEEIMWVNNCDYFSS